MKFSHRGIGYEAPPSNFEFQETDSIGKYRGAPMRFTARVGIPLPSSVRQLSYRGATYTTFH